MKKLGRLVTTSNPASPLAMRRASRELDVRMPKAPKEVEAVIFTEPELIWICPDGKLYLAYISDMPWARPDLESLLSKTGYTLENNYPTRGTYTGRAARRAWVSFCHISARVFRTRPVCLGCH